jgi:hypothetical protein
MLGQCQEQDSGCLLREYKVVTSARNGKLEVSAYFLKAKQGYTESYRQSVSSSCIHLDLKYTHLLLHFHDMFGFQKNHYQVN